MFDFTDRMNIGKEYNGFMLLSIDDLPDYKTKGIYLRHKITGLEVYHLLLDDHENTFAFGFRTFAKDSKGAAHIIEHSTLCGSERYPLKEPFNNLINQSIYTYLNALTYPDRTVYPGATVVPSEYFSMMKVYGDAVFFPLLDYETFIQEGHRLELDDKGKLSIQGVVYNEMKGNFSTFMQVGISEHISAMYPDSFASFDSGGDPLCIPDLTYEAFLDFHKKFYSPENCLVFMAGDIPTSTQLDFINENFTDRLIKKYNYSGEIKNLLSPLPLLSDEIKDLQKLTPISKSREIKCIAPDTGATGSMVSVNWYTGKYDVEVDYLNEILCGTDTSPVTRRLKESGLGDDMEPLLGLFRSFNQDFFSLGLMGVKKGKEKKVYALVEKVLEEVYEEGISKADIDAAIMEFDFTLHEVRRYWNEGPFALSLMSNIMKAWTYGDKPDSLLHPITAFEELKKKIHKNNDYTRSLIKKYLLDKPVSVKITVEPSKKYFSNRKKKEAAIIKRLEKNLDKEKLKQDLDKLHQYQQHIETPEETACIPPVKLSEIKTEMDIVETKLSFVKGSDNTDIPLFINEQPTNGIFYMDVLFPFDNLSPEYFQYIPTLSSIITNMGWNKKNWNDCIMESSCVMGDVWGRTCSGTMLSAKQSVEFAEKYKDYNFMGRNWLGYSCKALTSKVDDTLRIMSEIISKMDFDDEKRFDNLMTEIQTDMKAAFVSGGRELATKRVRSTLNYNRTLEEIFTGITQFFTVDKIVKSDSKEILKTYRYIYDECLKNGGIIHITADTDSLKEILPKMEQFARKSGFTKLLPKRETTLEEILPYVYQLDKATGDFNCQVIKTECQTGYAVAVSDSSPSLSIESAAESIFTSWFSNHNLWDKLRTTGGAYGAGAFTDGREEQLFMYTYRDPTPDKSLDVFLSELKAAAAYKIPEEEVQKIVVSAYGESLSPCSPKEKGSRGFEGFLYGNPGFFKKIRAENILKITSEDVSKAAVRLNENAQKRFRKAVFCDKSLNVYGNVIDNPL